ncbi:MAG: hypothetical protein KC478_11125 [Bacteriovoracaceae bacterium]|nr:hypothetical protein [Bacteriovoracaceae bacterium]
MKALAAFLLIGTAQLWASTFNFVNENVVEFNSSESYELISPVEIEVLSVSTFMSGPLSSKIAIDGKEKTISVKAIDSYMDGSETVTRYEGVIARDTLTYGNDGEHEAVEYVFAFTEINEYGHYSIIRDGSLRAELSYTFDYHTPTTKTVYPYTLE